jgi:hypothetical protein
MIAAMKSQEQTYETQLNDITPLLDANDVWHYSVVPPTHSIYCFLEIVAGRTFLLRLNY